MKFKNIYINYCYLIHTNGLVDAAYVSCTNQFVGVPYNFALFFFTENLLFHRNLLTHITKQQSNLFI